MPKFLNLDSANRIILTKGIHMRRQEDGKFT